MDSRTITARLHIQNAPRMYTGLKMREEQPGRKGKGQPEKPSQKIAPASVQPTQVAETGEIAHRKPVNATVAATTTSVPSALAQDGAGTRRRGCVPDVFKNRDQFAVQG